MFYFDNMAHEKNANFIPEDSYADCKVDAPGGTFLFLSTFAPMHQKVSHNSVVIMNISCVSCQQIELNIVTKGLVDELLSLIHGAWMDNLEDLIKKVAISLAEFITVREFLLCFAICSEQLDR